MTRFYLTGQHTFANRGCEAIVRSTVSLLKDEFGDIDVIVPSSDIDVDKQHWPDAELHGVRFVPYLVPRFAQYWSQLQRWPAIGVKCLYYPFALPQELEDMIMSADYVLSVGGDKYSLDYLPPVLLLTLDRYAMSQQKRVVLWGASVGPFDKNPAMENWFIRHLAGMSLIAVREPITHSYLESLGLGSTVIRTVDSAFVLEPQPVEVGTFWPLDTGEGVMGLNLSPIVAARHNAETYDGELLSFITEFARYVVEELDLSILLIPHVTSREGNKSEDDRVVLRSIYNEMAVHGGRISIVPGNLNAAQIKYVISRCRYFIGARTHSTIAAISSNIPTLSIGYSVKASGINQDIFGHTDYVMNCSDLSTTSLIEKFRLLTDNETILRRFLQGKNEQARSRVGQATALLRRLA